MHYSTEFNILIHNKHYSLELLITDKGQGVFIINYMDRYVKKSNYLTI